MGIFHSLQETYDGKLHGLPIPTITEEEFYGYDTDNDEIVTWEEYEFIQKGLGYAYA